MAKRLNWIEAILQRPEKEVGSIKTFSQEAWILDDNEVCMKKVKYNKGLVTIIKEILSNATDHYQECLNSDTPVTFITVNIDDEGRITVTNNGKGFEVKKYRYEYNDPDTHEVLIFNTYPAEFCFRYPIVGSNFDDTKDRKGAGRNGLGAKVTNVLSTYFYVECIDAERKKMFTQEYRDNRSEVDDPVIRPITRKTSQVSITFLPDYERFGWKPSDTVPLLGFMCAGMAACTGVRVMFNDENLTKEYGSMRKFASALFPEKQFIIFTTQDSEVVLVESDPDSEEREADSPRTLAFVNAISVQQGVHVDFWLKAIFPELVKAFNSRTGKSLGSKVSARMLYPYFTVIINCLLVRPDLEGATKDSLAGPLPTVRKPTEAETKRILKWTSFQRIIDRFSNKKPKKVDQGSAVDALWAKKGINRENCNLFVAEGKSAQALINAGIDVLPDGRKANGSVPIRGKIRNISDLSTTAIMKNKEACLLIQLLGCERDKDYRKKKDYETLRYSSIYLATDQDDDGFHIRGLLLCLLHTWNSTLFQSDGFSIKGPSTPVVKLYKGPKFSMANVKEVYYSLEEFKQSENTKLMVRYYKGLGTSSPAEFREYFRNLKEVTYEPCKGLATLMRHAFSRKPEDANVRKEWVLEGVENTTITVEGELPINNFFRNEFRLACSRNVIRAIPSVVDGMKDGQRKIIYVARQMKGDCKLSSIAGRVIDMTDYHHGEQSIYGTTVKLAQGFPGALNVPLMTDDGGYGSRENGGKCDTAPRYLIGSAREYVKYLFHPDDDELLEYNFESGKQLEPKFFVPILPLSVINRQIGIGSGFSTTIPSFNPLDAKRYLEAWFTYGEEARKHVKLTPWYRGFKGDIKTEDGKVTLFGKLKETSQGYDVTELPIGTSFIKFRKLLDDMQSRGAISSYDDSDCTISHPLFHLRTKQKLDLDDFAFQVGKKGNLGRSLMVQTISLRNMVLLTTEEKPQKFESVYDIIDAYANIRLSYYVKRRKHLISKLQREFDIASSKRKFIMDVRKEKLDLRSPEDEVVSAMNERGYFKLEGNDPYSYLKSMHIWSLTETRAKQLENEMKSISEKLETLKNTKPKEMWQNDMDEFEKVYEKYLQQTEEEDKGKHKKKE